MKLDNAGDVWFTEGNAPGIGELNPITGKERDFLLPSASRQAGLTPTFLVLDQRGNVWFINKDGNLFFEDDATGQIGELLLAQGSWNETTAPMIHEWSIPQGIGFYNIEFDPQGTTLWISDTAGFGSGGSVYRFSVNLR